MRKYFYFLAHFYLEAWEENTKGFGIVAQFVECQTCDQGVIGSSPTFAMVLCPWAMHFFFVGFVV